MRGGGRLTHRHVFQVLLLDSSMNRPPALDVRQSFFFPVMPVSCAVELGRARMPKADMPWLIYDHDIKTQQFVMAVELRGDLHE